MQQRLVQEYLDAVMASSQRQVLIEATIVEVTLSQEYQSGVDWGRIAGTPGSGIEFKQQMLTSSRLPVSPLSPVAALTFGAASQSGIFGAIRLLERFGNTRVLSSPKVMAINNQTALLKVVRNLVYFQVQQQQSQAANTGTLNSITTIARTVPVGLVMSLTPQINETGNVTLTVRPTVTSQVDSVLDPNPLLSIENKVPVVEVREIESVLQLASGQTAILGGLIKDEVQRDRDQVPGLGRTRIGDAFAYRNEVARKTELVIFLRPTVIRSPSLDSDELKFLRTQLPRPEQLTAPFEMPPAR
jgi:general secretion pathway protein D